MLKTLFAATAACFAVLSGPATAAPKPDLAIYGQLPTIETVEISPDGTRLAIVASSGDQRILTVRQIGGGVISGMNIGAAKLRGVEWAGPDHLLLVGSQTTIVPGVQGPKQEYFMVSDFDVATGKQAPLLNDQASAMNIIVGWPMPRIIDGQAVAILEGVRFVDNRGQVTLYRTLMSTRASKIHDLAGEPNTNGWLVNAAGEAVAQSLYDQKRGVWYLKTKTRGAWRQIDEAVTPMGSYGLAGFGRDGKSILVWRTDDKDESILREYQMDGTHQDLAQGMDQTALIHDPVTLALLGGYKLDGDDLRYTFFDATAQKTWDAVRKPFGADYVSLASWSHDRRKVVVRADSQTEGPGYFLVNLDTKRADFLGPVYKGVDASTVSPVRSIKYKAADGLEISGYLTLPKGRDPKNLPLIVLPHGGPQGRDTPAFDWWSQALASRGYAVLQPNFRGSEGFGWNFIKAGFGEWGKKMQTDLSDGVRDLARQGIVDPKRVCIMGASYGGYAALAGATLDKGVYRCAVSVAGPSDLQAMLATDRELHNGERSSAQRYWMRFMGANGLRDPDLATLSPARQAAKIDIPVLLIHGKDDTVVRYDQSQTMASAMKRAGKPVEFVTLDGEDHWLSRGATRQKMLNAAVAFVEKHNPPE